MKIKNSYRKITDLLFLGEAIDLPYYDFVIGVETLDPRKGVAYNHDEGEKLKARLLSLESMAILHLSYQPAPPKEQLNDFLKKAEVNYVKAAIGIAIIDPLVSDNQVKYIQTPREFLSEKGIVEEHPEKLLNMLKERIYLDEYSHN